MAIAYDVDYAVPAQPAREPAVVFCAWCRQHGRPRVAARSPQSRRWRAVSFAYSRSQTQAGVASHGVCPTCQLTLRAAWGMETRSVPLAASAAPATRRPGVSAAGGPAQQDDAPQSDPSASTPRRVVIIEDDRSIATMLQFLLEGDGYEVTVVDSAIGAAELVRQVQPHAILLDLGLPYRSGALLLAELKSDPRTAAPPVIIVSALTASLTPERRALAAAVISKPFRTQVVLDAVKAACAQVHTAGTERG